MSLTVESAEYNAEQFEIDGRVTSYSAIAAGEFEVLSDTVARFTGHPPAFLESTH